MWQRHQALAREFSEWGINVVFCEPHPRGFRHISAWLRSKIGKRSNSVHSQENPRGTVRVIPWVPRHGLPGFRAVDIKRNLLPGLTLVLFYLPSRSNVTLLRDICPQYVVYDNVLDWSQVPKSWYPAKSWENYEQELYRLSKHGRTALTTDSRATARSLEKMGLVVRVVHPAADEEFSNYEWQRTQAGPVGYFGTVRYEEIDVEYLRDLSEITPTVVVGELDHASRSILENSQVRIVDKMELSRLVAEINEWSAIVLPYRISGRSSTLMPAKIWNAIATRKPVFAKNLELDAEIQELIIELPADVKDFTIRDTQEAELSLTRVPDWRDRAVDIVSLGQVRGRYANDNM